jgi:hypothetical protein
MDCNLDSESTVRMVVFLPMTVAEFNIRKQQTFKEAIAKTAGETVRADRRERVFIGTQSTDVYWIHHRSETA